MNSKKFVIKCEMKNVTLSLIYICVLISTVVGEDIHSSLVRMEELFSFDRLVGKTLLLLPEYDPVAQRYLDGYEAVAEYFNPSMPNDVTGNPLHIYAAIKRLTLYFTEVLELLTNILLEPEIHEKNLLDLVWKVVNLSSEAKLPDADDLCGAALALARLQQVYRLSIQDMIKGRLQDHNSSVRLSVTDCIRIGNESYHIKQYSNSWQWYTAARDSTTDPDMKEFIAYTMEGIAAEHDRTFETGAWPHDFWPKPLAESRNQEARDTEYFQLCRGENHMTMTESSKLRCHFSNRGDPWLTMQPVKYEELHYNPEMYMFYEVITDHEVEIVKEQAKSMLVRSTVGAVLSESWVSPVRVSHTGWLWNQTHPLLNTLARRVKAIIGLRVYEGETDTLFAGEPLQVLSYGIGGHYDHHMDTLWKDKPVESWEEPDMKRPGDRLATWMFYLSNVEAGGRTAFPKAGIAVSPVKGAAVFWYNLQPNGHANPRSMHGGCPVMRGHKWVGNKWIHENANADIRGCGLNAEW